MKLLGCFCILLLLHLGIQALEVSGTVTRDFDEKVGAEWNSMEVANTEPTDRGCGVRNTVTFMYADSLFKPSFSLVKSHTFTSNDPS